MIFLLALLLSWNTARADYYDDILSDAIAKLPMGQGLLCVRGDGTACTSDITQDPSYRKIVVFPTGYAAADYASFTQDFEKFVWNMSTIADDIYSTHYASRILYLGFWLAGGTLDQNGANFSAKIQKHPIRGKALTLQQSQIFTLVDSLHKLDPVLFDPWAVAVLYNSPDTDATPNASPPSFLRKSYGIARITRGTVYADAYTSTHELAHASLNFLDEYTEDGLQKKSIRMLDNFTELALFDGSWGGWVSSVRNLLGVYQYRISEILAANGNDNIDITRYPSRVYTPGYVSRSYDYEGGMFFGKGTFHDRGKNIMNTDENPQGSDDGFAYAHSDAQWDVIRTAFEHPDRAARPNDRIRAVGPFGSWRFEWGSTTHVMLFDADKNHRYQPTKQYDVQVGWWDRSWETCWKWGFIPYPCYDTKWVTVEKSVSPSIRLMKLNDTALYSIANIAQSLACDVGYDHIKSGGGDFDLCSQSLDQISNSFLPSLVFPTPYQDVAIPASHWMTKYFWRFRTRNSAYTSGWTGWSSFTRAL